MLVLKSESERILLCVYKSMLFGQGPATGGMWLWSQVADMKLNDSELDLCSGSHLTNSIFPCHLKAMVASWELWSQWILHRGGSRGPLSAVKWWWKECGLWAPKITI